ncbi:hypothetical protein PQX77_019176 [Marasmius sp. AFHP31]|nr:hypothetical protein PQX77_019176 [Marasmius sp. AFHP31]
MSSFDITLTNPITDWKYVSEGGATIVFSYIGPSNPSFDGMVLRLRKQPNVPVGVRDSDSDSSSSDSDGEESEDEDPSISFQRQCMSRLIPKEHLPRLQSTLLRMDPVRSISVDEKTGVYTYPYQDEKKRKMPGSYPIHGPPHIHSNRWARALAKAHEHERPENRKRTGGVDVHKHKGVLATDLIGGNGERVSVEIKVAQMVLPTQSNLPLTTNSRDSKHHPNNNIETKPTHHAQGLAAHGYCPLDLFSADEERVREALGALYDAWEATEGKVNNFKVFLGGKLLKVGEKHLLWDKNEADEKGDSDLRMAFISALVPLLTRTPALQVLNRLQRTLDMLDVEGLKRVWEAFHGEAERISELGEGMEEPTIDEWMGFIDRYLDQMQTREAGRYTFLPGPLPSVEERCTYTEPQLRSFLLAYLLSATFKDCSVMVRMGRLRLGGDNDEVEVDPRNVTIIDLDPKSMTRLRKWEVLDGEIVREYERLVGESEGERKVCVDAFGGGRRV